MKPSELLDLFRLETDDTAEPYLWSDAEFYIYLNEAQDLFVRLIGGITDRRSSITKVTYKSGDQFVKYDERIYRIKGASDETNRILSVRNYDNLESNNLEDDYGSSFRVGLDDTRTGDIKYLISDVETDDLQLYPIPDHGGFVRLFVNRRPLNEIVDEDSKLELPTYQHLCLLYWVKYKAFMKQDGETFDGSKATDFRAAFDAAVEDAKGEKRAREDTKRVVQYGGIPMT